MGGNRSFFRGAIMNGDTEKTFSFPASGMDVSAAFCRQRPRQIVGKQGGLQFQPVTNQPILGGFQVQAEPDPQMWANSTAFAVNMRGFEPVQNRKRGGSRCGASQYIPQQLSGSNVVQCLGFLILNQGQGE